MHILPTDVAWFFASRVAEFLLEQGHTGASDVDKRG